MSNWHFRAIKGNVRKKIIFKRQFRINKVSKVYKKPLFKRNPAKNIIFKKSLRKFAGRRRKFQSSFPKIALNRSPFLPKFWAPEFGGGTCPPDPPPSRRP